MYEYISRSSREAVIYSSDNTRGLKITAGSFLLSAPSEWGKKKKILPLAARLLFLLPTKNSAALFRSRESLTEKKRSVVASQATSEGRSLESSSPSRR